MPGEAIIDGDIMNRSEWDIRSCWHGTRCRCATGEGDADKVSLHRGRRTAARGDDRKPEADGTATLEPRGPMLHGWTRGEWVRPTVTNGGNGRKGLQVVSQQTILVIDRGRRNPCQHGDNHD